jgi:hypothetical protein
LTNGWQSSTPKKTQKNGTFAPMFDAKQVRLGVFYPMAEANLGAKMSTFSTESQIKTYEKEIIGWKMTKIVEFYLAKNI